VAVAKSDAKAAKNTVKRRLFRIGLGC